MWTLDEYTWVFIGCGGTFYAASPYLAVLRERYGKTKAILIDPDTVESENYGRQWPGFQPGSTKVSVASQILNEAESWQVVDSFSPMDEILGRETEGRPVIAVVNVDNDWTRLDAAEWLASRSSPGIMIVSGCERLHGQCYPGIWMGGEAIFDWREHHSDVGQVGLQANRCNLQDVRANALTGVLVGMCIEDIAFRLQETRCDRIDEVLEFYWSVPSEHGIGSVRMWNTLAKCRKVVVS
jgi:hypothetical protein